MANIKIMIFQKEKYLLSNKHFHQLLYNLSYILNYIFEVKASVATADNALS